MNNWGASSYILAASEGVDDSEPETLQPMIIAEVETKVSTMSVGEAVMQMEISGAPVVIFRNESNSAFGVVYKRDDGNIGWIEPKT